MEWTEAFCDVLRDVGKSRPQVGDHAIVTDGRKHLGKAGTIMWHGPDRFAGRQYGDSYSMHLQDVMGTSRFRVRIQTAEGETFFVGADKIDIPSKGVKSWASSHPAQNH